MREDSCSYLKVATHWSSSGGGYGKMKQNSILPTTPRQKNFTTNVAECGDLYNVLTIFNMVECKLVWNTIFFSNIFVFTPLSTSFKI